MMMNNTAPDSKAPMAPRYKAYKDSGIAWLGEVPKHWKVKRLKSISDLEVSNVDKKSSAEEQNILLCNYVDVYYRDFISKNANFMKSTASDVQIEKFTLQQDDILITKDSESWDDIAIASIVLEDIDGVLCGYHLARIRPNHNHVNGRYMFRSFCTPVIQSQFNMAANGVTRYGLSKHDITSASFLLPPLPEQRAIAAYLDDKTAKLDQLIANKREQIAQLETLRKVTIHDAVTKGLNPNAPMKDSGIAWLGEVPKHWKVKRLKATTTLVGDKVCEQMGGNLYIGLENVESWTGRYLSVSDDDFQAESSVAKFSKGDVLFGKLRPYLAKTHYCDFPGVCSTEFLVIRPLSLLSKYIEVIFLTYEFINLINSGTYGTKMPRANWEQVASVRVPVPNMDEQRAIAAYLDDKTASLDTLIANQREQIQQLETLRKVTIHDAVTGKINVSGLEV